MAKTTVGMIEQHNELFTKVSRATTNEDMQTLYTEIKSFVDTYKSIDKKYTERLFNMFVEKLQGMLEENDVVYKRMNDKVENIRNKQYDFSDDTDTTQVVQQKVLQLMSELPSKKTTSNANQIINKLNATIATGIIGCKSVLELLKYPAYSDMLTDTIKQHAFEGSKSATQQAFETSKEIELSNANKALTSVYMQGFHLRKLNEKVTNKNKIMNW